MSIQWFPGHMNAARKEAAKTMEVIDVVVEVLDARIPNASCNPLIEELRLTRQRPSLKVLNKADLADPAVTQTWLDLYNRQPGVSAVALSCSHAGDAAKVPQLCQPLAPHRNSSAKPLRMLIMGVPNVGKSTLMNMLLKRRIARVGDEPAVTKVQQRHKLNDRMAITDSPGLLWGTIKDPHVGLLLATINAVGHTVVDDEAVAEFLATILLCALSCPTHGPLRLCGGRADKYGRDRRHRQKARLPADQERRRAGPRQSGTDTLVGLPQRHARPHQLGDTG